MKGLTFATPQQMAWLNGELAKNEAFKALVARINPEIMKIVEELSPSKKAQ